MCAHSRSHAMIHLAFMRKCNFYGGTRHSLMSRAITAAIPTDSLDVAETKPTGCSFSDTPMAALPCHLRNKQGMHSRPLHSLEPVIGNSDLGIQSRVEIDRPRMF